MWIMSNVTQILGRIESGDPSAAEQLLPLVYEELRKLAAIRLAGEKPGQTLQATALVHDAYLRLVDGQQAQHWNNRGHFLLPRPQPCGGFLLTSRRKKAEKRGGEGCRLSLEAVDSGKTSDADDLLDIDQALTRLADEEPQAAQLIKLRYFGGLSIEEAAELVGISRSMAYEQWSYARCA